MAIYALEALVAGGGAATAISAPGSLLAGQSRGCSPPRKPSTRIRQTSLQPCKPQYLCAHVDRRNRGDRAEEYASRGCDAVKRPAAAEYVEAAPESIWPQTRSRSAANCKGRRFGLAVRTLFNTDLFPPTSSPGGDDSGFRRRATDANIGTRLLLPDRRITLTQDAISLRCRQFCIAHG